MGRLPRVGVAGDDEGSAIVEFLGMALLLLVPLVYLILTLARVQAAAYGAEYAARESSRGAVVAAVKSREQGANTSRALELGQRRGEAVAALAVEDFGFDPERSLAASFTCASGACLAPGSDIVATVTVTVDLPGLPGFVGDWIPLRIAVHSSSASSVDGFASGS